MFKRIFRKIIETLFPFIFSRKTYLAYGVEPSSTRYPLERARFPLMASYIHAEYQKLNRPVRVLDIGCSEGFNLKYCRVNGTKTEHYGVDVLEDRLAKSLEAGYQSVLKHDIRILPLPYEAGFFDVAVCSHILEHLEFPERLLGELKRVLKPDGLLIIGFPTAVLPGILWRRYVAPLYDPRKSKENALRNFQHVTFLTLGGWKRLTEKCGFFVENARGDFFFRSRGPPSKIISGGMNSIRGSENGSPDSWAMRP